MSGPVSFLIYMLLIFLGGLMIRETVVDFKRGRYFSFGIDFMFDISICVIMIDSLLTH
jgi:hypothetical protein